MGLKTLFLLRHAKAMTGGLLMPDQDRPLSERGVKDGNKLANKLYKKGLHFDLIVSSPAVRTINTAHLIINKLDMKRSNLLIDPSIYEATELELITFISRVSKRYDELLVVGHNPSVSALAMRLTGESIAMPTCSLMRLSFNFKDWGELLDAKPINFSFLN